MSKSLSILKETPQKKLSPAGLYWKSKIETGKIEHYTLFEEWLHQKLITSIFSSNSIKNRATEPTKWLDIGCGSGWLYPEITHKIPSVEITLLDEEDVLSPFYEKKGWNFLAQSIFKNSLNDNDFNVVTALNLLAYLPPPQYRLFMSESARLLKKEGTFILSTLIDLSTDFPLELLKNLIETEFEILETKSFSIKTPSNLLSWKAKNRKTKKLLHKICDQFQNIHTFCGGEQDYFVFFCKRKPLF